MDIVKMLAELHAERDHIDEAILVLSRLAAASPRRRGRPPKWLSDQNPVEPKRRGRPPGRTGMSAAARKATSERMKKYWAERRKQKPT